MDDSFKIIQDFTATMAAVASDTSLKATERCSVIRSGAAYIKALAPFYQARAEMSYRIALAEAEFNARFNAEMLRKAESASATAAS